MQKTSLWLKQTQEFKTKLNRLERSKKFEPKEAPEQKTRLGLRPWTWQTYISITRFSWNFQEFIDELLCS